MQSRNLFIINVKCLWMWIAEVDVSMLMRVYSCCFLLLHFESSMKTQCIENEWNAYMYVFMAGWLTTGCKFYGARMYVGLVVHWESIASMHTFSALKIIFRFLFRLLFCCLFPVSVKKWFDKLKAANTKRSRRRRREQKQRRESERQNLVATLAIVKLIYYSYIFEWNSLNSSYLRVFCAVRCT